VTDSYLPVYADRPGEQVLRPPYVAQDVRLHLFFVDADVDRLNDMLDTSVNRVLAANAPGGMRARSTGQPIIFMFAEIDKMFSEGTGYVSKVVERTNAARRGLAAEAVQSLSEQAYDSLTGRRYVGETELGIWVPITLRTYGRREPAFYLPFVFNGTPASVVTGREVYGYPKQFAYFVPDDRPARVEGLQMSTWHCGPGKERYELSNLLTITPPTEQERHEPPKGSTWQDAAGEALRDKAVPKVPRARFRVPGTEQDDGRDPDLGTAEWDNFVGAMVRKAPLCFLRQFRDPVNPADASLQQVITARFVIQQLPDFVMYNEGGNIEVQRSDTLDLIADLGLVEVEARKVAIRNTVRIDKLDFVVDLGKIVG
jgi:hypothetical protein